MNEALERMVTRRAHGACEYCGRSLEGHQREIDHIWPQARAGDDDPANLALACSRCNRNKGIHLDAADPLTGMVAPLFHPRRDRWADHFVDFGGEVVGRSVVGRATAVLLFRRTGSSLPEATSWSWLSPIEDEVLRRDLSRMRVLRLTNDFDWLKEDLDAFEVPRHLDARQRTHAAFVRYLLAAEICLTRVRVADVDRGLRLSTEALYHFGHVPEYRAQIESNRSVLLQQLGTALQLAGRREQAVRARLASMVAFASSRGSIEKDRHGEHLRMLSRRGVIAPGDVSVTRDDFRYAAEAAGDGAYRPLLGVADVLLANRGGSPVELDEAAEELARALQTAAYGQDVDHARAVVVRRRWWGIEAARGAPLDLDLLARDVAFWRRLSLFNELREVALLLRPFPDASEIVAKGLRRRGAAMR